MCLLNFAARIAYGALCHASRPLETTRSPAVGFDGAIKLGYGLSVCRDGIGL